MEHFEDNNEPKVFALMVQAESLTGYVNELGSLRIETKLQRPQLIGGKCSEWLLVTAVNEPETIVELLQSGGFQY